jgi:hypothetical protein
LKFGRRLITHPTESGQDDPQLDDVYYGNASVLYCCGTVLYVSATFDIVVFISF